MIISEDQVKSLYTRPVSFLPYFLCITLGVLEISEKYIQKIVVGQGGEMSFRLIQLLFRCVTDLRSTFSFSDPKFVLQYLFSWLGIT